MIRRFVTAWASFWGLLYWWKWVVGIFPLGDTVAGWWDHGLRPVIRCFGRSVLQVQRPILFEQTGSGDGVASWIETLLVLVISAVLAGLWLFATRGSARTPLRDRLPLAARSCVRYGVGFALIVYGVFKVFGLQMGMFPSQLTSTIGSKTPMGMLWTFMAVSPGYQALTGAAELLAGVLLFAKRTTLLGSLVGTIFMAQVFALNVFFDVPVKLLSFALLISCVGLAFPDFRRLMSFFVLNRATEPTARGGLRREPLDTDSRRRVWIGRAARLVAPVLLGIALYRPITQTARDRKQYISNFASAAEKKKYRLYEHGIRWIQERPDNQ
jgi:hypothetical protein